MIRVFIVDDHVIVRQGLRRILEEAEDIEVVGEAANGVEALKRIQSLKWDVMLLDISMPEKGGEDTLKQLMEEYKNARVLILSMYCRRPIRDPPDEGRRFGLPDQGCRAGTTDRGNPASSWGKKNISPSLAELLLLECNPDPGKPLHATLSDREYQVLKLLGSGKKVSEIAAALSLSVKTVSTYRAHILEKMKLKNNAELTFYVIQNGLLQ